MFFILSKTITVLLLPTSLIVLVGLTGIVLAMTRWRRVGVRLMIAGILLLAIGGA